MSRFSKKNKSYKTLYLTGLCSFAKVYDPDEYRGNEFWKINLYPDEDSMRKIKNSGLQLKRKEDDGTKSQVSGEYYTFRRPVEKEFGDKTVFFTPPIIKDHDNNDIMKYTLDGELCFQFEGDADVKKEGKPVLIGNGSKVEISVFLFETGRFGWGHRLNGVKILDLVEYNPDTKEDKTEESDDEAPFEESKEEKKPEPVKTTSKKVNW